MVHPVSIYRADEDTGAVRLGDSRALRGDHAFITRTLVDGRMGEPGARSHRADAGRRMEAVN